MTENDKMDWLAAALGFWSQRRKKAQENGRRLSQKEAPPPRDNKLARNARRLASQWRVVALWAVLASALSVFCLGLNLSVPNGWLWIDDAPVWTQTWTQFNGQIVGQATTASAVGALDARKAHPRRSDESTLALTNKETALEAFGAQKVSECLGARRCLATRPIGVGEGIAWALGFPPASVSAKLPAADAGAWRWGWLAARKPLAWASAGVGSALAAALLFGWLRAMKNAPKFGVGRAAARIEAARLTFGRAAAVYGVSALAATAVGAVLFFAQTHAYYPATQEQAAALVAKYSEGGRLRPDALVWESVASNPRWVEEGGRVRQACEEMGACGTAQTLAARAAFTGVSPADVAENSSTFGQQAGDLLALGFLVALASVAVFAKQLEPGQWQDRERKLRDWMQEGAPLAERRRIMAALPASSGAESEKKPARRL